MRTFIVLIPVNDSITARKSCEMIENTIYKGDSKQVTALDVLKKVMFELEITDPHGIEIEPLTDFMDRCNDQELNLDNYFISYVHA